MVERDLFELSRFFRNAYGEKSAFANQDFLSFYFSNSSQNEGKFNEMGFAAFFGETIVSYYGILHSNLVLNQGVLPIKWMVNAFTLSEYRGKGLNTAIIENLKKRYDTLGVISFPKESLGFYESLGFNTFQRSTLSRYIYNLNEDTFEVVKAINQDVGSAKILLPVKVSPSAQKIDTITSLRDFTGRSFNFHHFPEILTTYRTKNHFTSRYLNNPYITYLITYSNEYDSDASIIVVRKEKLYPTQYFVYRIVDLYGNCDSLGPHIDSLIAKAYEDGALYLDFSCFGVLYEDLFKAKGFSMLKADHIEILPQVTYPIENRKNLEFVALFSKTINVNDLSERNVYFTRGDSDRDRINKLEQINI